MPGHPIASTAGRCCRAKPAVAHNASVPTHRQAHRKIASTSEKGPRYRRGRPKPKVASQDFDLAREFGPEKLSQKTNLHFERVNEMTFKLTDGEGTSVTCLTWSLGQLPHHEDGGFGHQYRAWPVISAMSRRGLRTLILQRGKGECYRNDFIENPIDHLNGLQAPLLDRDGEAE